MLSFQYKDGVLIAGDRRATAGNIIMYDRADKVIELDQDTIIAIAGSPPSRLKWRARCKPRFNIIAAASFRLSASAQVAPSAS